MLPKWDHFHRSFGKSSTSAPAKPSAPATRPSAVSKPNPAPIPAPLPSSPKPSARVESRADVPLPTRTCIDHDVACAILIGLVDGAHVQVSLDAIVTKNRQTGEETTMKGWMRDGDLLSGMVKMYVQNKKKLTSAAIRPDMEAWEKTKAMKARDEATSQVKMLREQLKDMLEARGALDHAKELGFKILGV